MKILLSILIGIVIVLSGLGAVWYNQYRQSFVDNSFSVSMPDVTVDIYNSHTRNHVASFDEQTATVPLRVGTYYYTPRGDIIAETETEFTVGEEGTSVTVNPSFTEDHLATLLQGKEAAIQAVVTARYPELMQSYTAQPGALYGHGEWYGTLLRPNIEEGDIGDNYRVVLRKTDSDAWEIVRYPEIILTANNYPNVPIEILHAINAQVL